MKIVNEIIAIQIENRFQLDHINRRFPEALPEDVYDKIYLGAIVIYIDNNGKEQGWDLQEDSSENIISYKLWCALNEIKIA